MISTSSPTPSAFGEQSTTESIVLVRYGAVPEVARCSVPVDVSLQRHDEVVVRTHRGLELSKVVEFAKPLVEPHLAPPPPSFRVERLATDDDIRKHASMRDRVDAEFDSWVIRIKDWGLDLQLIDMEWTLEQEKLILYVLNERGPECTKLALQVAAAGLGIVEVQPVGWDGPVAMPESGGGCGSCGCH